MNLLNVNIFNWVYCICLESNAVKIFAYASVCVHMDVGMLFKAGTVLPQKQMQTSLWCYLVVTGNNSLHTIQCAQPNLCNKQQDLKQQQEKSNLYKLYINREKSCMNISIMLDPTE